MLGLRGFALRAPPSSSSRMMRIPEQSDHPFRTKAITYSGVSDHPAGRPASDGVS
jgi:hypothetical protein